MRAKPDIMPGAVPAAAPAPRRIGLVNWRGLWTLYLREVARFVKVGMQTVGTPVVTSMLFFIVFTLALGGNMRMAGDIPLAIFLTPGLIMMAMLQNAFANTSSSIMISKIQGNIVDVLMPPLSPLELLTGFIAAGVTRGILVGAITGLVLGLVSPVTVTHWGLVIYHTVAASMLLATLGVLAGIWADRFDHMAAITNFLIMPLSFLSGSFYSIERLPDTWQNIARLNPFFYMIDGFRAGFIGFADAPVGTGILVTALVVLVMILLAYRLLRSGYKLKA